MPPLSTFQLPLHSGGPPAGYGWVERELSELSTTTAFNNAIDRRDRFLGERRCVVCGYDDSDTIQHCHIIGQKEVVFWSELKTRGWIPQQTKEEPKHEPRDGILMCPNHHGGFDNLSFFIRYSPETQKFVFVNYSNKPVYQQFHGKAIALDIKHRHAPFPSLFIIHEMRVRGYNPFQPIDPDLPDDSPFQDWLSSDRVLSTNKGLFNQERPPGSNKSHVSQHQPQFPFTTTDPGPSPSGRRTAVLNADVIADILEATRASPSWKACVVEGTSWTGTATENIQKYISSVGVENH